MMLEIPDVLTASQARQCREQLQQAAWQDGRQTAGPMAAGVKANEQLADGDALAVKLGALILERLTSNARFMSAALPLKILPPRFNRYRGGGTYGNHIDNSVFSVPGTPQRVRSDLSATLFFTDPTAYEGGELVIEDGLETRRVKLPAGHLVLYPASTLHRVTPVTRGTRLAAFFWIQSQVREESRRTSLMELEQAIQALTADHPDHPALVRLSALYQKLLREWADA